MNNIFNGQMVGFMLKEKFGWDNPGVFPSAIELEHDCDRSKPYEVDGHIFYDRKKVVYTPGRTCHIDFPIIDWETGETDYKCSECGFSADPQDWAEVYRYCPNCGAKVITE